MLQTLQYFNLDFLFNFFLIFWGDFTKKLSLSFESRALWEDFCHLEAVPGRRRAKDRLAAHCWRRYAHQVTFFFSIYSRFPWFPRQLHHSLLHLSKECGCWSVCMFRPAWPGCAGSCVATTRRKQWASGRDTAMACFATDTATPQGAEGEAGTGMRLWCLLVNNRFLDSLFVCFYTVFLREQDGAQQRGCVQAPLQRLQLLQRWRSRWHGDRPVPHLSGCSHNTQSALPPGGCDGQHKLPVWTQTDPMNWLVEWWMGWESLPQDL